MINELIERANSEAFRRGYEKGKQDALLQKDNLNVSTIVGYEFGYEVGKRDGIKEGAKEERERIITELREAFSHVRADDCFGEMNSDKCNSYTDKGECFLCAFDSIVATLRQPE